MGKIIFGIFLLLWGVQILSQSFTGYKSPIMEIAFGLFLIGWGTSSLPFFNKNNYFFANGENPTEIFIPNQLITDKLYYKYKNVLLNFTSFYPEINNRVELVLKKCNGTILLNPNIYTSITIDQINSYINTTNLRSNVPENTFVFGNQNSKVQLKLHIYIKNSSLIITTHDQ